MFLLVLIRGRLSRCSLELARGLAWNKCFLVKWNEKTEIFEIFEIEIDEIQSILIFQFSHVQFLKAFQNIESAIFRNTVRYNRQQPLHTLLSNVTYLLVFFYRQGPKMILYSIVISPTKFSRQSRRQLSIMSVNVVLACSWLDGRRRVR